MERPHAAGSYAFHWGEIQAADVLEFERSCGPPFGAFKGPDVGGFEDGCSFLRMTVQL